MPVALVVLATGLLIGCSSPTALEPLPITLAAVRLETDEEFRAWPSTPVISGGGALTIRGTALAGCGTLAAEASRSQRSVLVRISARDDHQPCASSKWAWEPFTATIGALAPGNYDVQLFTAGHAGRTAATVAIR